MMAFKKEVNNMAIDYPKAIVMLRSKLNLSQEDLAS